MTESYWHSLNEAEWAELIRSEPSPSLNHNPIALKDAADRPAANGSSCRDDVAQSTIACVKAPPISADLATFMACLGIPLQAASLTSGRRRMALDRLNAILRDWAARSRG
jgi:hypothetical protein